MCSKFCAILVLVWIWLFVLKPAHLSPITSSSSFQCNEIIKTELKSAILQSKHSLSFITNEMNIFENAANLSREHWIYLHQLERKKKSNIHALFDGQKPYKDRILAELEILARDLYNLKHFFYFFANLHNSNSSFYLKNPHVNHRRIIVFFEQHFLEAYVNYNQSIDVFKATGFTLPMFDDYNRNNSKKVQPNHMVFEFLRVEEYKDLLKDLLDFYVHILKTLC